MELWKQSTWSRLQPSLFHFRTVAGQEVDIVLEDRSGHIVGIEVKSSATVQRSDLRGLQTLAAEVGDNFVCGAVLYGGAEAIPFGQNLWALPLDSIWRLPMPKAIQPA